jgi:hypothetical protein
MMTDCIRDILFSSESALRLRRVLPVRRADFLPPLEIPGAATPPRIRITTGWVLITRGTRGAAGRSGNRRGGRASTGRIGPPRGSTNPAFSAFPAIPAAPCSTLPESKKKRFCGRYHQSFLPIDKFSQEAVQGCDRCRTLDAKHAQNAKAKKRKAEREK